MRRLKRAVARLERSRVLKRRKVFLVCQSWRESPEDVQKKHLAEHPGDHDAEFVFLLIRRESPPTDA